MKKLLAVLGISLAILIALVGYAYFAGSGFGDDKISSGTLSLGSEADRELVLPTREAIEPAVSPAGIPTPVVVSEEVELKADEPETLEPQKVSVTHSGYEYAYERLDDSDRELYDAIYQAIVSYDENAILPTLDTGAIDRVFNAVLNDHPEIFYVTGYKYTQYSRGNVLKRIGFGASYSYSKEERDSIWRDLDAAASSIVASVPGGDDYSRVKYVYDTIVNNTEYNLSSPDNQNIISVLLNHSSVCQGYAKTMQLILNRLGIPTTLVTGKVISGEGHAWNLVKADGDWYYVDATWGDASYVFMEEDGSNLSVSGTNYDYLLVNGKDLFITHYPDMDYSLPECESLTDNYFVREGLYFDGYNTDQLRNVFNNTINSGASYVKIKASDDNVYSDLRRELLDNQHLFDYLNGTKQVRYSENAYTRTLTFWL